MYIRTGNSMFKFALFKYIQKPFNIALAKSSDLYSFFWMITTKLCFGVSLYLKLRLMSSSSFRSIYLSDKKIQREELESRRGSENRLPLLHSFESNGQGQIIFPGRYEARGILGGNFQQCELKGLNQLQPSLVLKKLLDGLCG